MRLIDMSISTAARLMELGDISAVELLEDVLHRVKRLNPVLNALCHLDTASAVSQAGESDRRRRMGQSAGTLDGIPLHVKDNIFVKDMRCTWGSRLYQEFVPRQDDWVVKRLRKHGSVLFAKSNTPEMALLGITTNDVFGPTVNPYDATRTPGGSSGGGVVAAMARMGFGGIATDAGGSIRRPCGYAGAVGLRTSPGVIPRKVGFPSTVSDFQTIGPICSCLADLDILFAAIRDTAVNIDVPNRQDIRIQLILNAGLPNIDPDVETAVRNAAKALADLGYQIDEMSAPWDRAAVENAFRVFLSAGTARIAALHDCAVWESKATAQAKAAATSGQKLTAVEYVQALDFISELRGMAKDQFDGRTVWLMPTSPCTAWKIPHTYPPTIADREAGARDASIYTPVVNAMAAAGLALPNGLDRNGLPIGLQLVAGYQQEDLVLSVGRELVRAIGELTPPHFLGD